MFHIEPGKAKCSYEYFISGTGPESMEPCRQKSLHETLLRIWYGQGHLSIPLNPHCILYHRARYSFGYLDREKLTFFSPSSLGIILLWRVVPGSR